MGYAELIERLQALPAEKQAEVFDFVEFLAGRNAMPAPPPPLAESSLGDCLRQPLVVAGFQPLSREDANAR